MIWADFFGHAYCKNGIKTRLGSPMLPKVATKICRPKQKYMESSSNFDKLLM